MVGPRVAAAHEAVERVGAAVADGALDEADHGPRVLLEGLHVVGERELLAVAHVRARVERVDEGAWRLEHVGATLAGDLEAHREAPQVVDELRHEAHAPLALLRAGGGRGDAGGAAPVEEVRDAPGRDDVVSLVEALVAVGAVVEVEAERDRVLAGARVLARSGARAAVPHEPVGLLVYPDARPIRRVIAVRGVDAGGEDGELALVRAGPVVDPEAAVGDDGGAAQHGRAAGVRERDPRYQAWSSPGVVLVRWRRGGGRAHGRHAPSWGHPPRMRDL